MSAKNVPISSVPSVVVIVCSRAASWPAVAEGLAATVELESIARCSRETEEGAESDSGD